MNFKIKFGDLKVSCNDFDMNSFIKVYEKVPQKMFSYYAELGKSFERYANLSKLKMTNFENSADSFQASGHDTYNYVARYGISNFQGQVVLKLDGILDYGKLAEAIRLSVDVEPVFGCRYVENDPPYWKRRSKINEIKFCSLEMTDNAELSVKRFLESPLDMDKDPMVKVKVFRSDKYDTICFKINHVGCDATGMKEYILLLAEIYSSIAIEDGTYIPEPKIRRRNDQDRLFEALGIKDMESAFVSGSDIYTPTWSFPWRHLSGSKTCTEVCRLPSGILEKMQRLAHLHGATINDLILAAYYRAMLSMGQPEYGVTMELSVTVDLRRYLPDKKTEAIRNFSGSLNTRLIMIENETFADTLSRVAAMMGELKSGTPGLQSALGLERLEKTSFRDIVAYYQVTMQYLKNSTECNVYKGGKCIPTLSNIGYFSRSLIKFGEITVTDAYIVPPAVAAPGFLLMVGTYNDIVTLAGGFYEAAARREDIRKLLRKIRDEVVEGCSRVEVKGEAGMKREDVEGEGEEEEEEEMFTLNI